MDNTISNPISNPIVDICVGDDFFPHDPEPLRLRVIAGAAGVYVGTLCPQCGPYSRESGNFATEDEAQRALCVIAPQFVSIEEALPQDAALAKRIDDAIQYRAGVEPTAYGLLMAIRWTLNNLVGEDVTMGASGLILDVLHAQTED